MVFRRGLSFAVVSWVFFFSRKGGGQFGDICLRCRPRTRWWKTKKKKTAKKKTKAVPAQQMEPRAGKEEVEEEEEDGRRGGGKAGESSAGEFWQDGKECRSLAAP